MPKKTWSVKKKSDRRTKAIFRVKRRRSRKVLTVATLGLLVTLSLGSMVGPGRNLMGSRKLRALVAGPLAPAAIPSPGNPSKEYIYAGGRLIATEEPNASSMMAPVIDAASVSSSRIDVTWATISGADHYQVEKTTNVNTAYTVLSSNVVTTSFSDTGVIPVNAYLYRVRAVDALGNVSPYSNVDLATAITFTDDPLQANSTLIKAQHIWELRQAVNAVRATAPSLPPVTWTDNVTSAGALVGITVKAAHIEELRSKLDEALTALGLPMSPYTDPVPPGLSGVAIKKIHIDQLRQRVK